MTIVSFVGAGPGDKDLITLKGYRRLAEADVIIYAGSLVNPELLDYCKEGAEKDDSASMTLEDIISKMQEPLPLIKRWSVCRLATFQFMAQSANKLKS